MDEIVKFIETHPLIDVDSTMTYDEWYATTKEYLWYNHPTKVGFKYKVPVKDLVAKQKEIKNR